MTKRIVGSSYRRILLGVTLVALASATTATPTAAQAVAHTTADGPTLTFEPVTDYASVVLRVRGPNAIRTEAVFAPGVFTWQAFDEAGQTLPDGAYTFELRANPVVDQEARAQLAKARETGAEEAVFARLRQSGRVATEAPVQTGYFLIRNGSLVAGNETEPLRALRGSTEGPLGNPDKTTISGDLSVYNSLCVGFDCLASETYGSDTIRLKENTLRIHFDDTSTIAGFASTDWRIEANSSLSGGSGYFAILDASANRTPFLIEASAPNNALYVDNGGRIGVGTSNPVVNLHVATGNTPTLRLEQTAGSGFSPQTWDLAGNEVNFFVRDVTSGSRLPLRIRPGAPSSALDISATGDLGIGTASPTEDIHIVRNSVPVGLKLQNSADGRNWSFKMSGSGFAINEGTEASTFLLRDNGEMRVGNNGAAEFVVDASGNTSIDGNLSVTGNITATGTISDRNRKQAITAVDGTDMLTRVLALPVSTWVYDHQTEVRHIGPMAQDFHAAFGLGTEESIGLTDLGGLSLVAIQELSRQLETKDTELQLLRAESEQLRAESAAMQTRLEALETALLALQQN